MEGDPRNRKISLLRKYDIPIDHISFEYVEKCTDKKELERIVRILRSGEEGFYPDLLRVTEERLRLFAPDSRVLRQEVPVLTKECLGSEEWKAVENDLLSWEKEMLVIDKGLDFEKGRIEYVGKTSMPEIRKTATEEKQPKFENKKQLVNNKNARIKSGDYASWDKFDVDKELLKIDVEQERKEEENQRKKRQIKKAASEKKIEIDIDKDSYTNMEQQVLANQAKDRGNECYKSGDLTNALKYYNISIKLYPTSNAYNNRAMTYLKLKQFEDAVKDCNAVLSKEKNNIKALHRRATAYQNMANNSNNYDTLALHDLTQIVFLEPNNKIAQLDLQKLKKKLGIQDSGKVFRMPIYESEQEFNKENKSVIANGENRSMAALADVPKNIEKLPFTYYGPSTSSFECEPYSMAHRALSGSFLSTEIMCKCNSNRLKQNPLCQKCGEAMCKPKPVHKTKVAKVKSEPLMNNSKTENNAKNLKQKLESKNKIENAISPPKSNAATLENKNSRKTCKETENEASIANSSSVSFQVDSIKVEVSEPDKNAKVFEVADDDNTNNLINSGSGKRSDEVHSESSNDKSLPEPPNKFKENNPLPQKVTENNVEKVPVKLEISSDITNSAFSKIVESEKSVESSLADVNGFASGKSKTKKKKSKNHRRKNLTIEEQLEMITPVKVVHADKYIHPTSVEPNVKAKTVKKVEEETREPASGINQFKAFVPNRKCFGLGNGSYVSSAGRKSAESPKPVPLETESMTACERNKENFVVVKKANVEVKETGNADEAEKPDIGDLTPYKFASLWGNLQKSDVTYTRRAHLIRSIGASKLREVVGVKLDCEMLITMLECLEKHFVESEPTTVLDFLKQLPQIPRFGLIKMFLAETDKKVLKNLIASVENKGFIIEEEVKKGLAVFSS